MSLTMVTIDKSCDSMIIISDKRSTAFDGHQQWFLDDKTIKHHIINDKICFMPGSVFTDSNKPNERLALLLQFSFLPASKLIAMVKGMNRKYIDVNKNIVYDHVILSGINDENKFFILCGQPDGTFNYQVEVSGEYKGSIATNGQHLQRPAAEYLASRIKVGESILQAMKKTVEYVSNIEKTVSPTYNYTIIKKTLKRI